MAGEQQQRRQQFQRAPIFKMLAAELKNTTHELPKNGGDQWESQYYLTPSGEAVSKVMMIGVATEKEDVGDDQPFWRLRISDPTGGIMVYSGKFQPEAAQIIAGMDIPCFVAVVGRPSIYRPEGGPVVSIRPDTIVVVDEAARNSFLLDAAGQLIMRVKEMWATPDAERIKKTRAIYEGITPAALLDIADMAVKSLLPAEEQKDAGAEQKAPVLEQEPEDKPAAKADEAKPPEPKKGATPAAQGNKPAPKQKKSAAKKEAPKAKPEDELVKVKDCIYKKMQEKKTLRIGEIPGALKEGGFDPDKVDWETAVKALMNEGMCTEPRLGELRAEA